MQHRGASCELHLCKCGPATGVQARKSRPFMLDASLMGRDLQMHCRVHIYRMQPRQQVGAVSPTATMQAASRFQSPFQSPLPGPQQHPPSQESMLDPRSTQINSNAWQHQSLDFPGNPCTNQHRNGAASSARARLVVHPLLVQGTASLPTSVATPLWLSTPQSSRRLQRHIQ